MIPITGIDHVAITVTDLAASCRFYQALFGGIIVSEYHLDGRLAVCQIAIGGASLSIHQLGNQVKLVAKNVTPGSGDICFRWNSSIEAAVALLQQKGISIVEGPSLRRSGEGLPAKSIYFHDPDGNLIELLAADDRGVSP